MRIAFYSPLPPLRTGIADYSAALLEPLRRLAEVSVIDSASKPVESNGADVFLYQVGNNTHHGFVYDAALKQPGVIVLHEANLHHLIAEMTIRRNDWDAYLEEVEYDGGPRALEHARRVRELEVGPDYENVPMLRRLLERSQGVIVHNRSTEHQVRTAGFTGPIAVIPHGAWVPRADRMEGRSRLGLDERTPLIGIFGFLKPYKRIREALRAFRRLVRVQPGVRMILVGESHPELPMESLIRGQGLPGAIRHIDYAPIEEFVSYMAACDIVVNLRYPTAGESSGTLLRALGLGKAVLVSDVGSFAELPDEICLKVPVGASEEDLLFEYLNLLVSRPELARELGAHAARWVERECNWGRVAGLYVRFLEAVVEGRPWGDAQEPREEDRKTEHDPVSAESVLEWSGPDASTREYAGTHLTRLSRTLEITPAGTESDRVLEMGTYLQIAPVLKTKLGYGEVRGCYYGPAGKVDHRRVTSDTGEPFECEVDLFDAEEDPFPYPDGHFSTVLCCELIEHLASDPMHTMAEINRILRRGGHIVLTTPNAASLRALSAVLQGYHPGFYPAYLHPARLQSEGAARHNREYAPKEIWRLLLDAGFEVVRLETGPFLEEAKPEFAWVSHMLASYRLPDDLRGDGIYAVGRKTGPVKDRYPDWLYS